MKKEIRYYLILVFLFCFLTNFIVAFTGQETSALTVPLGLLTMMSPLISVFITYRLGKFNKDVIKTKWKNFSIKGILIATITPVIVCNLFLLGAVYLTFGNIPLANWITNYTEIINPPLEMNIGESITISQFILKIAIKLIVGILILSILTFGEEFGWRLFLQNYLEVEYGVVKSIVLTSFLWAIWHIPFSLSGIHFIPEISKWSLSVIMPLGVFGLGLFICSLYAKYKSIWIVVFAHAAQNNWSQFFAKWFLILPNDFNKTLLISMNTGLVFLGILSVYLISKKKLPNTFQATLHV